MVTSGDCGDDFINCPTEVIKIDGPSKMCPPMPPYSENVMGATGGLVGKMFLSCGGELKTSFTGELTNKCYTLGCEKALFLKLKKLDIELGKLICEILQRSFRVSNSCCNDVQK